jgi:DNA-binding transcriptional MerR regulator
MASEEPVRMLEADSGAFELTEIDAPEEELLGRYLPIGDVAKSIGVNPSVLRFWEQEFPQLRPTKRGNRRYYCSEDVALIRTIQHLLYEEHYTILGARNKIHELQVQNKVKGILDEKKSAPLVGAKSKKSQKFDFKGALAELRAIRELLATPDILEHARQEKLAKEKAEREAVENFTLVSEDLNDLLAQEAAQETQNAIEEAIEAQEEVIAPHSYDLGAIGVESEDFLQPSPMIGNMKCGETKEKVVQDKAPKAEDNAKKTQEEKVEKKVDTSHLVVPPLPGQGPTAFTIGMKVPKGAQASTLTYSSTKMWKK